MEIESNVSSKKVTYIKPDLYVMTFLMVLESIESLMNAGYYELYQLWNFSTCMKYAKGEYSKQYLTPFYENPGNCLLGGSVQNANSAQAVYKCTLSSLLPIRVRIWIIW